MKDFLKSIKLIDQFETELIIQKHDFVQRFLKVVDQGSVGTFSNPLEAFSSSKNEFKGEVGINGFRIRRIRKFFQPNMSLAIAKGRFTQRDDKLIINTEIDGLRTHILFFYIFGIIFYGIFLTAFLSIDKIEGEFSYILFPFLILHAVFMFGIPYFVMRRSVKRMKYELEREFAFVAK
ncbi:MAG: hypothetical protein CMP59_02495 [Flavobacteriales bacterium]|mgnify:CR=1 FL=1|nr:hypothetical protein [Flavobacteriales bacterium]